MSDPSEFYLGYADKPPAPVRQWLQRCVPLVLAVAGFSLGAFASAQQPFSDATFAFGDTTTLTGRYIADPYPALLIYNTPADVSGTVEPSRVHLVGQGKFGAQLNIEPNTFVSVSGTLIAREQQSVLEVIDDSVATIAAPDNTATPTRHALGAVSLRGEIVDSKCHLGVMKPGEGTAHRACAIRCISGGLPPMLVTRNDDGHVDYILMSQHDGSVFDRSLLAFVGKPVQVSGMLERRNGALYLDINNNGINRL
ncbi:MAG: hypothetical protein AAF004_07625 [Pseudomonadota bacterium]